MPISFKRKLPQKKHYNYNNQLSYLFCLLLLFQCHCGIATEVIIKEKHTYNTSFINKVTHWLEASLQATEHTLGPLPQTSLPIDLKTVLFTTEVVPWAEVKRGEVDTLVFHINRFASLNALKHDWTVYHEMAHLYHPLFDYADFWLAEGLATYMQNVIMYENRIISRHEFVQRLVAGLERGRINAKKVIGPLNQVSEKMWQLQAYQRVYWSGVAFFIEAELALIAAGKPRLTTLIANLNQCCRQQFVEGNKKTARLFVSMLDKLSRSAIFSSNYTRYKKRESVPRFSKFQLERLITPKTIEE